MPTLNQWETIIAILVPLAALWRHFEIKAIKRGKEDAKTEEMIRRIHSLEKNMHELQRDFLDLLRD